jgi:hypothetical protein
VTSTSTSDVLVVRLRSAALSGDLPLGQAFDCAHVADVIEAQQAEIERMREELGRQRTAHQMWFSRAFDLEEQLEEARRG